LFRDTFDPIKGQNNQGKQNLTELVTPMTGGAVRQYYNRLLFSIGLRSEKKKRHDFSVHSFRKWFKTRCEIGGMKPVNVETLLNHSTGISDSYYRPRESELLSEYLAVAEQHLSISTENKFRTELEREREENRKDLEEERASRNQMAQKLMEVTERLEKLEQKKDVNG
jgi:hypothetical protein